MRKLLLISSLSLFSWVSYAQLRTKIDSLERLANVRSLDDTIKVKLLIDLANTYRSVNLDTSYLYAKKAYQISSNNDYTFGTASASKIKGTYFLYTGIKDSCIYHYHKSQKLFQKLGDVNGVHDINYNLGLLHTSLAEYNTAISYYKKDFNYRHKIKDTLGIADGYLNMGSVYLYMGDNKEAYKNLISSIPYFEQAGDTLSVAKANFNLGTIQWNYSNYDLALNHFFSSLEIFEKAEDHHLLANCHENIAGIYENMGNFNKAAKHYNISLKYSTEVGDTRLVTSNLYNMGVLMDKNSKKDSAIYYINKSLALAKESDFKDLQSLNYHSLGAIYAPENLNKGITFLEKSISLKKDINFDNSSIALSLATLGDIYRNHKQFSKARNALEEGLGFSAKTDSKEIKSNLSFSLYQLYKSMEEEKRALNYLEQYHLLKDSIYDEETNKNIAAREIQYETAKKDQQIQLLTKEKELQKAATVANEALVKQRSTQRNLLLGGIASLLIISSLVFRNYRLKLKSRDLIHKKQNEFVKLRSRFFANISHEFRTPLTLILGPLKDMLSSKKVTTEDKEGLQLMERNGERLLDLVNQLLDLAKLEEGNMPLKVKEKNLHTFFKTRTASFSSLADFRNIDFRIHIAPDLELAWFDEDKLEKIINNLLSNAFKFTPEKGCVKISSSLMANIVTIKVSDNGKGIPKAELDKIFDRFYQVDNSATKEQSGSGIGLALTKELIELHHGTISLDSTEGKGSIFTVKIPINKEYYAENEIAGPEQLSLLSGMSTIYVDPDINTTHKEEGKTKKGHPLVLVVEDNKDVRSYIKKQLEDGYNVIEAVNGEHGFKKAIKLIPELIISDLMMPKMGGMEFCKKIKTDEKTSHIPVILLTAVASRDSKLQGIETGADDYILKPFDKKELTARVKNLIEQRKQLRERYSRQVSLEPKAIAVTSTDERFLQKVIRILEEHLDDSDFSVSDFGKEIGMSRTQLFRKLRALTNQSVSDFIRDFRLKRAAYLLKNNAGNISDIAYQVGFNNLSYFTKCFKELFGKTPSEFLHEQ